MVNKSYISDVLKCIQHLVRMNSREDKNECCHMDTVCWHCLADVMLGDVTVECQAPRHLIQWVLLQKHFIQLTWLHGLGNLMASMQIDLNDMHETLFYNLTMSLQSSLITSIIPQNPYILLLLSKLQKLIVIHVLYMYVTRV